MLTGGLGNQMFCYALMVRLSRDSKSYLFHPYSKNSYRYGHQGYQLNEIFELRKSDKKKHFIVFLYDVIWHFMRFFPHNIRPRLLKIVGVQEVKVQNFVFKPELLQLDEKGTKLFEGTWQSEDYFIDVEKQIREALTFREDMVSLETKELTDAMVGLESVSLHVRRDDYLTKQYADGFGGICTTDYYNGAVEYLRTKVDNPSFYIFSDDLEWCKSNLDIPNAVFVDWNRGADSWQDMYIMSKCKHNIIANSTFSWWGAWLNSNPDKMVIAPSVWWNGLKDDVVPNTWIRIDNKGVKK